MTAYVLYVEVDEKDFMSLLWILFLWDGLSIVSNEGNLDVDLFVSLYNKVDSGFRLRVHYDSLIYRCYCISLGYCCVIRVIGSDTASAGSARAGGNETSPTIA